jgi:hypothetical protein
MVGKSGLTHLGCHAAIALQHSNVLPALDRPFPVLSESKMEQNVEKQEYETPSLTVHGSIETITQGGSGTTALDAAFPAHTPFDQLTFS